MFLEVLSTARGGLAITGDTTSAEAVKTPTIDLENLVAINKVGHRGAPCGQMRLLTVRALRIDL